MHLDFRNQQILAAKAKQQPLIGAVGGGKRVKLDQAIEKHRR